MPDQGLRVVLSWADPEPGASGGLDLDLHLRHPLARDWGRAPLDCYYANGSPDWGTPGAEHDPTLHQDQTGPGFERIDLTHPEDTRALGGAYQLGVEAHNLTRPDGEQISVEATVHIYADGVLVFEQSQLLTHRAFWDVAWVNHLDGQISLSPPGELRE